MLQALVGFCLRQRIPVLILAALLGVGGILAGRDLPVALLPDLHPPVVSVLTEAGGLAPEEVEQLVTYPLESVLNGMPDSTRVRSVSSPGLSLIHVEFPSGSDPYRNRQLVTERVAIARDRLPEGLSPQLAPMSSATGPILQVAVTSETLDSIAVRDAVDWIVRPRLMAVDGVSQVLVVGGDVPQFRFTPDLAAMRHLGIGLSQIEQALSAFGANSSGGYNDAGDAGLIIRNVGHSHGLDDIRNLVVAFRDNRPVVLGQLGEAALVPKARRGDGSIDGRPAVLLSILRHPSAHTVAVTAEIRQQFAALASALPKEIRIDRIAYSQADLVEGSVHAVRQALIGGLLILATALLVLLANLRWTLSALLAVPVTILAALLVFRLAGFTIDIMTLGGLALVIGQVAGQSVTVVEAVRRRVQENRARSLPKPMTALIADAMQEVRPDLLCTTLVLLLVFLPLLVLPGQLGMLFGPFGVACILAIVTGFLLSLTLTPALCSYLPVPRGEGAGDGWVGRLRPVGARMAGWALDNRQAVLVAAGGLALLAALALVTLPRSHLPPLNETALLVRIVNKPGIPFAESVRIGQMAERLIQQVPEVTGVARRTGRNEYDEFADPVSASEFPVRIAPTGRSRAEVADDLRRRLSVLPVSLTVAPLLTSRMQAAELGVDGDLVLKIVGPDTGTLRILAETVRQRIAALPGVADLAVENLAQVPQVRITMDYARAKLFGVTPAAMAQALESLWNGRVVSRVVDDGKRFDVLLKLSDADRTREALAQLGMDTPAGHVPLSSIADVVSTDGPNRILREGGQRRIAITINAAGADLSALAAGVRRAVAETPLPQGYAVTVEGAFRLHGQARTALIALAVLSAALIFLVLVQRYRSMALAGIVLVAVPPAFVGGILALWLAGESLSLPALVGFFLVAGMAIRNGVLTVGHLMSLSLHGSVPVGRDLVIRGCGERLGPALTTTVPVLLALIPVMVLAGVPGGEFLYPLTLVVFGGLLCSALLEGLVTPVLFHRFGEPAVDRWLAGGELPAGTY